MNLTFEAVAEVEAGAKWQAMFRRSWPGWRTWFEARGGAQRPPLKSAVRALRRYMPEFLPTWERLVDLAGGDEVAARFLTFWCPPAYLLHCSQAILIDRDGPLLIRNYDLDPALSEATVLHSAWHGRRVIATVEGIIGAADGLNEDGLAVSLAFGGRRVTGRGFGIPLILRYILEVCGTTSDAVQALRRVPSHMAYNITVVDRTGAHATVYVAPDRPAIVTAKRIATNHQRTVEWPEQARFSRTLERERNLEMLLQQGGLTAERMIENFLQPPLFNDDYAHGFGTVYTASYRPAAGRLALHWPDRDPWRQSFAQFREDEREVQYLMGRCWTDSSHGREPLPRRRQWLEELRGVLRAHAWALPTGFADALADNLEKDAGADWKKLAALWYPAPTGVATDIVRRW